MAELIGLAAGVLALSAFAFKSSASLYQTVKSLQNNRREIRELKEELEALNNVIESLQRLPSIEDVQFEALCLPLLRCGQACKDFEKVIADLTKHSNGSKTSFRDWAKLKYAGSDIAGFKNLLAGYKATISIAIGDVNLRTAAVSANAIKDFKVMLGNTTTDLQDHLQDLDDKLEALSVQSSSTNDEKTTERKQIRAEIDGGQKCLEICTQAHEHANKVRTNVFEDVTADIDAQQVIVSTLGDLILAKRVTAGARATQYLGQMSDETVQALARSRGIDLGRVSGILRDVREQDRGSIQFEDQYGSGHKLG